MTAFSNFLENELLDHVLRGSAYTSPAPIFVALYTDDPTDADSGTEVAASGYARLEIGTTAGRAFTTASGGSSKNNEAWEMTASTAWGTITHFGLRDATAAGNLLYYGALTTAKVIGTDDILRFSTGSLSVKHD